MSYHPLALNMRLFWKSSRMVSGMLGSNNNPNRSRYIRLIVLSATQVLASLPITLFSLFCNLYYIPIHPWISWDNTHLDYSVVGQFPSAVWRADATLGVLPELDRWILVFAAFIFFAFFGFAEEALRHYRKAYTYASHSLHLPGLRKSGAGSSLPHTSSSSFGHGFKTGIATFSSFKNPFSAYRSRSKSETITTESKGSVLVSEYRLTSDTSILEGVDNPQKVLEVSPPGDDDFKVAPTPASRSSIEALPAVSNLPVPPPPIARVSVRPYPPGLYPSFPNSPTASDLYLDPSEAV